MFSTREEREEFIVLTNEAREIQKEIETAQITYRALTRCPDLYTGAEQTYWIQRLADLYARREWLEYALDPESAPL